MVSARRPKLYYKIGEVCRICGIEPHVLRYWEKEFPMLAPVKNRAGQRIYRQQDLELVETIRHLLHGEGYTIQGARSRLEKEASGSGLPLFTNSPRASQKTTLAQIRQDLEEIRRLLEGESSD